VGLLPHLRGIGTGELSAIDIIHDADADGELDASEESVISELIYAEGDGVVRNVLLSGQRLALGQSRFMLSIELVRRQTGQSGDVMLAFATTSLLLAGDRLHLLFPDGFDLSQAGLDASSLTPSGILPTLDTFSRTRRELVLNLSTTESAGSYRLLLNGVYNPAMVARNLAVETYSYRADGTAVDERDPIALPFLDHHCSALHGLPRRF